MSTIYSSSIKHFTPKHESVKILLQKLSLLANEILIQNAMITVLAGESALLIRTDSFIIMAGGMGSKVHSLGFWINGAPLLSSPIETEHYRYQKKFKKYCTVTHRKINPPLITFPLINNCDTL